MQHAPARRSSRGGRPARPARRDRPLAQAGADVADPHVVLGVQLRHLDQRRGRALEHTASPYRAAARRRARKRAGRVGHRRARHYPVAGTSAQPAPGLPSSVHGPRCHSPAGADLGGRGAHPPPAAARPAGGSRHRRRDRHAGRDHRRRTGLVGAERAARPGRGADRPAGDAGAVERGAGGRLPGGRPARDPGARAAGTGPGRAHGAVPRDALREQPHRRGHGRQRHRQVGDADQWPAASQLHAQPLRGGAGGGRADAGRRRRAAHASCGSAPAGSPRRCRSGRSPTSASARATAPRRPRWCRATWSRSRSCPGWHRSTARTPGRARSTRPGAQLGHRLAAGTRGAGADRPQLRLQPVEHLGARPGADRRHRPQRHGGSPAHAGRRRGGHAAAGVRGAGRERAARGRGGRAAAVGAPGRAPRPGLAIRAGRGRLDRPARRAGGRPGRDRDRRGRVQLRGPACAAR